MVYEVPAVPLIPKLLEKVATPFTAVAVVVPTNPPPEEIVAVTVLVESPTATLPAESCTSIIGCVVKATPEAVPTALRFNTIALAEPAAMTTVSFAIVREPLE